MDSDSHGHRHRWIGVGQTMTVHASSDVNPVRRPEGANWASRGHVHSSSVRLHTDFVGIQTGGPVAPESAFTSRVLSQGTWQEWWQWENLVGEPEASSELRLRLNWYHSWWFFGGRTLLVYSTRGPCKAMLHMYMQRQPCGVRCLPLLSAWSPGIDEDSEGVVHQPGTLNTGL